MSKNTQLLDKLKHTLDKPKASPTPKASPASGGSSKISVSLYPLDLERITGIISFMASKGFRISTSQAVQMAIRTAPTSGEALVEAYHQARSEDRRKA